jgi:hypothetical protein
MAPLDLTGNIVVTLSVTSLFLLVTGLPLVRGMNNKKNLTRHGYLTIVALIIQTIMVVWVMIPSFVANIAHILALNLVYSLNTWLHVALGVFAEISGFSYIVLWLAFTTSKMQCVRAKKYMMPTFIVWIIAIVTGALIHLLQMF